eukprot:1130227-Rhodomonas_salina.1
MREECTPWQSPLLLQIEAQHASRAYRERARGTGGERDSAFTFESCINPSRIKTRILDATVHPPFA